MWGKWLIRCRYCLLGPGWKRDVARELDNILAVVNLGAWDLLAARQLYRRDAEEVAN